MRYRQSDLSAGLVPHRGKKIIGRTVFIICQLLLAAVLFIMIAGGIFLVHTVREVISDAPVLDPMAVTPAQSASYIYSNDGKREQKLTLPEANRDLVTIDRIPLCLQHAFIAIEDERFYTHHGIDPQGIARAAWIGLTSGSFSEGASTITQQLLKNSVFPEWTSEVTFSDRLRRKIQEQYLAIKLETMLSKDQILEDYLNTINMGAGCYGVQAAAWRYFGKDVSELTLSESAVIAGITQNPSRFDPLVFPEQNSIRRGIVLDYMLEQKYITQSEYEEALSDDVYARIQSNDDSIDSSASIYTFYQDALIDQVMEDLMNEKGFTYKQAYRAVYTGGLRIYSAQDPQIQRICDEEFENPSNFPDDSKVGIDYALSVETPEGEITNYDSDDLRAWVRSHRDPDFNLMYEDASEARLSAGAFRTAVTGRSDTVLGERITITPQPQASVVVIDQQNGYIRAIVGGRGDKDASLTLNRASYTTRQPGSTFKILTTYAPALNECGKTLASVYDNQEYHYENGMKVSNWDLNNYTGPVTIRDAIIRSVNVVAVECITEITPRLGFQYAKNFGITTLVDRLDTGSEVLSDVIQPLALGGITRGVTNLELCAAYACIANRGQYISPKFYTHVLDQYGNIVLDNSSPSSRTVLKESTAWLLTDAMKEVITNPSGTAYGQINLGMMPAAGKSGTTENYRDIWFAGYTPHYTCCVWGGYDNNESMPDTGIYHVYNKVLWNSIMNRIHADLPVSGFGAPGDIVKMNICRDTHLAAAPWCSAYEESFAAGTQPKQYCNIHGGGELVTQNNAQTESGLAPGVITIFSSDEVTVQP